MKFIIAILLLSAAAFLQPTPAMAAPDVMADFNYVVGVWKPMEDPAKPAKLKEEYMFAPMLEGKFLISQEVYRDKDNKIVYKDCAVYGIDPDTHKLFFHAYNTDGSMDRSAQIDSPAGRWIFKGTVYGSDRFRDYRYTMTKVDENHLRVLIELLKDQKYEKLSETSYERTSKTPESRVQ